MLEQLKRRRHWVFDLDGTLTKPIYDFPAIKRRLGLPANKGILEALSEMTREQAAPLEVELDNIEREHAERSLANPGAIDLVKSLADQGRDLGILTRNRKPHALITLEILGLTQFFPEPQVLGREEAPHKPDPTGLLKILTDWNAEASNALFIGDNIFDIHTGIAAGVATIHLDTEGTRAHLDLADATIDSLNELI